MTIRLRPDDHPLPMIEGDLKKVEDSSAQNVLIAQDSNGHVRNRSKADNFKYTQINRRINDTIIGQLPTAPSICEAESPSKPEIGNYKVAVEASVQKSQAFTPLAPYLESDRQEGITGTD